MTIGYKKKDSNGPLYHPERDYAYITPTLMKTAIENLEAPSTEFRQWKENNEISEAEIIAVAEALADAQRDFVNGADPVDSLEKALARHGWFKVRLTVRLYLLAMIGEVMIGAWFKAVREVTEVGEESPAQNEMCRFAGAVREFAARAGAPVIDSNVTAQHLLFQNDLLRARMAVLHEETRRWRDRALNAEEQISRLQRDRFRPWWKKLMGIREA
jgi:hypothetical protein